jgi:hypothetical protein
MRNNANMLRQTPYAASTPIASEQSTEHTNINESLKTRTLNLIFFAACRRIGPECTATRSYSCKKSVDHKDHFWIFRK